MTPDSILEKLQTCKSKRELIKLLIKYETFGPDAIPALPFARSRFAEEEDRELRCAYVAFIQAVGGRGELPFLASFIEEPAPMVRGCLAVAIYSLGDQSLGRTILLDMAESQDEQMMRFGKGHAKSLGI